MKISTQLLHSYISEHYSVIRFGQKFQSEDLSLPIFYSRTSKMENGKLYIVRTQDLPQTSSVECMVLCTGSRPADIGSNWRGEILYIEDRELDVFALFNFVTGLFDRTSRWDRTMEDLLVRDATVKELVLASLPLFENCITITDYNLRILVITLAIK